jgi:hypothetical protein
MVLPTWDHAQMTRTMTTITTTVTTTMAMDRSVCRPIRATTTTMAVRPRLRLPRFPRRCAQ